VADEMLSKKIEGIEDALGNEVYFFSLKNDRKQIDRQNDFNEERVYISISSLSMIQSFHLSFSDIHLKKSF
jgi:hypothetical protein